MKQATQYARTHLVHRTLKVACYRNQNHITGRKSIGVNSYLQDDGFLDCLSDFSDFSDTNFVLIVIFGLFSFGLYFGLKSSSSNSSSGSLDNSASLATWCAYLVYIVLCQSVIVLIYNPKITVGTQHMFLGDQENHTNTNLNKQIKPGYNRKGKVVHEQANQFKKHKLHTNPCPKLKEHKQ